MRKALTGDSPSEYLLRRHLPVDVDASAGWSADASSRYNLWELWATIRRRKGFAGLVFLVVLAAVVGWILKTPATYQAGLRLLVQGDRIEASGDPRRHGSSLGNVKESELASEVELIRSPELLEKLAEQYSTESPQAGETRRQQIAHAARRLERALHLGVIPGTNLISIQYGSRDPNRSADVVNSLAALYLEKRTALRRSPEALQFFNEQLERYDKELREAQRELSEFLTRHSVSMPDAEKQANLLRIGEMEASLQQVGGELRDAQERAELLRAQIDGLPRTLRTQSRTARNESLIQSLKSLALELENQRTELLSRYSPGYRLVQEVEKKLRDTRAALQREEVASVVDETEALNPLRQSIDADYLHTKTTIAGLTARHQDLKTKLRQQIRRQGNFQSITAEHAKLARQLHIAEENYLLYQSKREGARIASALDQHKIVNVSVIAPATPPALPVDQHRPFLIALGFMVAICAATGTALLADRYHRPAATAAEIASLTGVPVLRPSEEPQLHVSQGL